MAVYLVDRDLPEMTRDGLRLFHCAEIAACREFQATGKVIRYLQSVFIPGEQRCLCLFEAGDEAMVAAVNVAAGLPFTRIVAVLQLTAEGPAAHSEIGGYK